MVLPVSGREHPVFWKSQKKGPVSKCNDESVYPSMVESLGVPLGYRVCQVHPALMGLCVNGMSKVCSAYSCFCADF